MSGRPPRRTHSSRSRLKRSALSRAVCAFAFKHGPNGVRAIEHDEVRRRDHRHLEPCGDLRLIVRSRADIWDLVGHEQRLDGILDQVATKRRGRIEDLAEGSPVMALVQERGIRDASGGVVLDSRPAGNGVRLVLLGLQHPRRRTRQGPGHDLAYGLGRNPGLVGGSSGPSSLHRVNLARCQRLKP